MPKMRIERLALKVAGLDPRAGESLAQAVTAAFERMPMAADLPQRVELVRLEVRPAAGTSTEIIAAQTLAALARELNRSSG